MEKAKIRPLATPKPLNTKIGRRDYVLDDTRHAKFCSDQSGVSVPQIRDFAVILE